MFQKNKTQETTENGAICHPFVIVCPADPPTLAYLKKITSVKVLSVFSGAQKRDPSTTTSAYNPRFQYLTSVSGGAPLVGHGVPHHSATLVGGFPGVVHTARTNLHLTHSPIKLFACEQKYIAPNRRNSGQETTALLPQVRRPESEWTLAGEDLMLTGDEEPMQPHLSSNPLLFT
ncbi:hypothetical protein AAG570_013632 [Ranatra chinensis]|uniref:Uncharacterized protein n=1 Tax=Ranatra chinensis TaxID=642074 RepID=A0ABD0YCR6_9HEMI